MLTFIRPGTTPGLLLDMVKELPYSVDSSSDQYLPLSRAQVFSAEDGSMSLNIFVYGEADYGPADLEKAGARILAYADAIQNGRAPPMTAQNVNELLVPGASKSLSSLAMPDDGRNQPRPSPFFERDQMIEYLGHCSKSYIEKTDPRRFLRQRELFEIVSGTEGTATLVEVSGNVLVGL